MHLTQAGSLDKKIGAHLEDLRSQLLDGPRPSDGSRYEEPSAEFELAGMPFVLRPAAARGFRYRLLHEDLAILINPSPPPPIPTVRLQLGAGLLWRQGWIAAAEMVRVLAVELLAIPSSHAQPLRVSRADLCNDIEGWIPVQSDLDRLVTRAKHRTIHLEGDRFTGFMLGRGDIAARIYDKTLEIVASGKQWMLPIWAANGHHPNQPVWRVEFQLRREALRRLGITDVSDLEPRTGALWSYLTNWLRLVIPGAGDRLDRCPLDPMWEVVTNAPAFGSGGELTDRQDFNAADLERIVGAALGSLTSYAATVGERSLRATMRLLEQAIEHRLRRRDAAFDELVERKVRAKPGRYQRPSAVA